MYMFGLITYGSVTNVHEPSSTSELKCCNINGNSLTLKSVNTGTLTW